MFMPSFNFDDYDTGGFFDELIRPNGKPRSGSEILVERISELPDEELRLRQDAIDKALLRMGITFTVYGDESGTEKIFPFDLIPRIVQAFEWHHIEAGLKQRIRALNHFIDDIYHDQNIIQEGILSLIHI